MGEFSANKSVVGLNLDSLTSQIKEGELSFAMNAVQMNFDGKSFTYQNEQGNFILGSHTENLKVIGKKYIPQRDLIVFFLTDNTTHEIGTFSVKTGEYKVLINASCLNFATTNPIFDIEYRTTKTNELEIFWADGRNPMRFLNFEDLPYKKLIDDCDEEVTSEIDCNRMLVQPNVVFPKVTVEKVVNGGELLEGTYQYGMQYADENGTPYTSVFGVTNPISLSNTIAVDQNFNNPSGKSIIVKIHDIDNTGVYEYVNVLVVEKINNIPTIKLLGTFTISGSSLTVTHSGQEVGAINLSADELFEKFNLYSKARNVTSVGGVLVWSEVWTKERVNYQRIWNKVKLEWESYKLPYNEVNNYSTPENTLLFKGYMRDEIYALEGAFIKRDGSISDYFHIPNRKPTAYDLQVINNQDSVFTDNNCEDPTAKKRYEVYNTATVEYTYPTSTVEKCGAVPFQRGLFGYTESTDLYPCNEEVWGELANTPIRHHLFPDCLVSPHHDDEGNIYPLGISISLTEIRDLIKNSDLTDEEKNDIVGITIARGNRATNKTVVAKGMLFNVGKYEKDEQKFYFPNYPLNDVGNDPFLGTVQTKPSTIQITTNSMDLAGLTDAEIVVAIVDQFPLDIHNQAYSIIGNMINQANSNPNADANDLANEAIATLASLGYFGAVGKKDELLEGIEAARTNGQSETDSEDLGIQYIFPEDEDFTEAELVVGYTADSRKRYTFHSPDTHFYQPFLGNILKIETIEYGKGDGHFVQVKNHARYAFLNGGTYVAALIVGVGIGFASNTLGVSVNAFNGTAAFTAFQAVVSILDKTIPKINYAYQFNIVGKYTKTLPVANDGNKIRTLERSQYLSAGVQSVGADELLNNVQRESSVYLRTNLPLDYTHERGAPREKSRWTLSQVGNCSSPERIVRGDVSSYYASIKNNIPNPYGTIYSYETVHTGFFQELENNIDRASIFGGDVFITPFGLKRKLPFFVDNRVGFPDGADIDYREVANIGKPVYWLSTDIRGDSGRGRVVATFFKFFGVKQNNFDCKVRSVGNFFYQTGKFYLFAYGIPYFFCESEVNVDLRKAYNNREGDFYPHVGTGIPDEWLQETNVPIVQDNTYFYNKTFSTQNKENVIGHLSERYNREKDRLEYMPNTAFYSDENNWRLYRPVSKFDFPLNHGRLVSLDTLEDRAILARFENKSLLYNAMLTINTSSPKAAYIGNDQLFRNSPPLDFKETEYGYNGTQHKFFLKTEEGHISIDCKRRQIHVLRGKQMEDLASPKYKCSKFLSRNLEFTIQKHFPEIDIDNNFMGIGIHGTYDAEHARFIFTKLDYEPLVTMYIRDGKFFYGEIEVELTNPLYFCNKSFTMSFSFLTNSWVSFHSYAPLYYEGIGENFFTGEKGNGVWKHNEIYNKYNNFFGEVHPYIIEQAIDLKGQAEVFQGVKSETKVYFYHSASQATEVDNKFFNKAIIYNDEQNSGLIKLTAKPKNNMANYLTYPKKNVDNTEVLFKKHNGWFNYNTVYDIVVDKNLPVWQPSCTILSDKELVSENLNYGKGSAFKNYPIRGSSVKIRHILDDTSDYKFISETILIETQNSPR